jgi:hypothetical protein
MDSNILNKTEISSRAKTKWNEKSEANKVRAGSKYQHFLGKFKLPMNNCNSEFDVLTKYQQNVIVKGELIRTYDSLPNTAKTKIMREFGLSAFSSKWYKLPSGDKKILLNHVIR